MQGKKEREKIQKIQIRREGKGNFWDHGMKEKGKKKV